MRSDRFSRHWHDLTRLDTAGLADAAIGDHALARAVASDNGMFFAEKNALGQKIDYLAAVTGGLQPVAAGAAFDLLAEDYRRMSEDGLFATEPEAFHLLMARCDSIASKANALAPQI